MSGLEGFEIKVVKLVQDMLLDDTDSAVTPAVIEANIDLVLTMRPAWGVGLNRNAVVDELIRRFSMWVGTDVVMKDDAGHKAWLNSDRKKEWRYWQRYSQHLDGKLSWKAIEALDRSTDLILGNLEDPCREEGWDRRGLVVGHVQSGKTASYTGLICKAADAGYKIIVVLAGLHNNLRSQTQIRLEEGFLGYETATVSGGKERIGVGQIDTDGNITPNCATTRANNGDFNAGIANGLAISPEQRPWLFVVKKNKTPLTHLLRWIQARVADANVQFEEGTEPDGDRDDAKIPYVKKQSTKFPILVIDDEADHASVDTNEHPVDENGQPDKEHDPTTINRLIRRILHSFSRSAYVGYTATPFANVFIHRRGRTVNEGPDIFPSSFIINLAAPSNYIGPAKVFGLTGADGKRNGLPLVKAAHDYATDGGKDGWMPHKHKAGHRPLYGGELRLPPSLVEAIDAFILVCAARKVRGQEAEHCSMLVHVTRFTLVQAAVFDQIDSHLAQLRQRIQRGIGHEEHIGRLRKLWETDFAVTTEAISYGFPDLVDSAASSWDEIYPALIDSLSDIQVRQINGTAKDVLDYEENKGVGLKVIAVGGDKLARGLTLEGLCVSYFLRASKMYDTLMQMGRWFGYRPGYLDLCRLYTTQELIDWFGHIADASEELREEFDVMAAVGSNPAQYGLKVQSHPVLMVTSRLKMRTAQNLMLSFSGELLETVSLFKDPVQLARNFDAAKQLVAIMGAPSEINPARDRNGRTERWGGYFWSEVDAGYVVDFFRSYRTHESAYKVNGALIGKFIEAMAVDGELSRWSVLLVSVKGGDPKELAPGVIVNMSKRTTNDNAASGYPIGRLLDPKDESIDLSEEGWIAALKLTRDAWHSDSGRGRSNEEPTLPNGPAMRRIKGVGSNGIPAHPERGLLILYVLDPLKAEAGFDSSVSPIIAFGVSFPESSLGIKVEYAVDHLRWEQEYGGAE